MQFKIPQNVDVEDRVIAFISFKQLFILLGGGGVAYVLYTATVGRVPPYAYIIPMVVIMVFTVLIAFLKMDNLTFIRMTLLFFERLINPTQRVWRHYDSIPTLLDAYEAELQLISPTKVIKKEDNPNISVKNLNSIADIVDIQGFLNSDIDKPSN